MEENEKVEETGVELVSQLSAPAELTAGEVAPAAEHVQNEQEQPPTQEAEVESAEQAPNVELDTEVAQEVEADEEDKYIPRKAIESLRQELSQKLDTFRPAQAPAAAPVQSPEDEQRRILSAWGDKDLLAFKKANLSNPDMVVMVDDIILDRKANARLQPVLARLEKAEIDSSLKVTYPALADKNSALSRAVAKKLEKSPQLNQYPAVYAEFVETIALALDEAGIDKLAKQTTKLKGQLDSKIKKTVVPTGGKAGIPTKKSVKDMTVTDIMDALTN